MLKKFHALVIENQFLITDLIQAESGKNRRMAFEESCDVPMGTSHYIKRAPALLKDRKHAGPVPFLSHATEVRRPKGVVAIIAPWNFPFATGISDTIPALIAGNGVVVKPDNKTALSPLLGVRLLEEAGIPPGLVQVVCGEGPDVGEPMLANADYVMFTGSTATGRIIGELAGKNLIGACLELGGKNPMLVLEDANVDEAVHAALFGGFGNSGQICMHIERLYVHDSIYDEFRDKFVAATRGAEHRRGLRLQPDLGSLVSVDHRDRVASHVDDARAKGATVLTGGQARPDLGPAFYEPTILEGVTPEMLAGSTETFGPVVGLYRFTHRGRGDRARQRHRLRAQRQRLEHGHGPRAVGGAADRVGQREHQRHPGHGLRVEGHPVGRAEAVRRRRPPRRPGPAEVHRRPEHRGAQEAGHGAAAEPDVRRLREADPEVAEADAQDRASLVPEAIRTAVWGTGNVGRAAIRAVDAHPGLELAAVIVHNPDKVGRDAGDLGDVGRDLGVAATDDIDAVSRAPRPSSTRRPATSGPTTRSPTSSGPSGPAPWW